MDINPMNPMEAMAKLGRKTGQMMGPRPEPAMGDVSPEEAAMKVKFFESQLGKKGVPAPPPEVVAKYEKYKRIAAGAPKPNAEQMTEFTSANKIEPSSGAGMVAERSLNRPGQPPDHTRDVLKTAKDTGLARGMADSSAGEVKQREFKSAEPVRQENAKTDYFKSLSGMEKAIRTVEMGNVKSGIDPADFGLPPESVSSQIILQLGQQKNPEAVSRVLGEMQAERDKLADEILDEILSKHPDLDLAKDRDKIGRMFNRAKETGIIP